MTNIDLEAIRRKLGLSKRELLAALCYRGNRNTSKVLYSQFLSGEKIMPPDRQRLAYMLGEYGVPPDWTII